MILPIILAKTTRVEFQLMKVDFREFPIDEIDFHRLSVDYNGSHLMMTNELIP